MGSIGLRHKPSIYSRLKVSIQGPRIRLHTPQTRCPESELPVYNNVDWMYISDSFDMFVVSEVEGTVRFNASKVNPNFVLEESQVLS